MALYRPHRGGFDESISQTVEVNTMEELANRISNQFGRTVLPHEIKISHYGYDARCGWNTYMCVVEGIGPVGFTDSEIH